MNLQELVIKVSQTIAPATPKGYTHLLIYFKEVEGGHVLECSGSMPPEDVYAVVCHMKSQLESGDVGIDIIKNNKNKSV